MEKHANDIIVLEYFLIVFFAPNVALKHMFLFAGWLDMYQSELHYSCP